MTKSLLWKLLGVHILVIVFVIIIVWLAVDYLSAGYFVTLMEDYNISPTSSHQMFVASIHRYLVWASLAAILLSGVFSFLIVKRLLGPLTQMTGIAKKISAGDYSGRAPIITQDEVGQLAVAFNHMAENLQHVEQLRKNMVIDVAHELRTPLTNIQGYIEALVDEIATPSRETFELLLEETMRLVHLVEAILRLAKADAARIDLHKKKILLRDLIDRMIEYYESRFSNKNLQVETHYPEETKPINADPDKISQVVGNLFQNAWQYTPLGGIVRIMLEFLPGELKLVVANKGVELSEKDVPFLFERFFRTEKSRSRDHGGAGIGLAVVKELIESHDGHVGAELDQDEIRVWFTLPF